MIITARRFLSFIAILSSFAIGVLLAPFPTQARELSSVKLRLPATFVLADDNDKFYSPQLESRKGKYQVSMGECHGGSPGYVRNGQAGPFDIELDLYHLNPRLKNNSGDGVPADYRHVSIGTVDAQGRLHTKSRHQKLQFYGLTLDVEIVSVGQRRGLGQTQLRIRASE